MTSTLTTLGSWEAEHVTVAQVEEALSELRRGEVRAAVRTSVLTLVVVVDSRADGDDALEVVRRMSARHPSRTLVIVTPPGAGGAPGIDASAAVQLASIGERQVCFEDVVLEVRGSARHHLDSIIEPFTLPDLPVAVWLPKRLPALGDPLLTTADRVIVDTRAVSAEPDPAVFERVAALSHRLPVTDLSWVRLAPWRSLLAGQFEGAAYRPFLADVHRAEVVGHYGPRQLLGGWLLERLGLRRSQVHLAEAPHVSVRIEAAADGRSGRFQVVRPTDAREIIAEVDIDGGPTITQVLRMRDRWPERALADALTRMGHDEIYEVALAGAMELGQ
jgi:glucose-6-phosphate dehydrogenase assembly protein OpcA